MMQQTPMSAALILRSRLSHRGQGQHLQRLRAARMAVPPPLSSPQQHSSSGSSKISSRSSQCHRTRQLCLKMLTFSREEQDRTPAIFLRRVFGVPLKRKSAASRTLQRTSKVAVRRTRLRSSLNGRPTIPPGAPRRRWTVQPFQNRHKNNISSSRSSSPTGSSSGRSRHRTRQVSRKMLMFVVLGRHRTPPNFWILVFRTMLRPKSASFRGLSAGAKKCSLRIRRLRCLGRYLNSQATRSRLGRSISPGIRPGRSRLHRCPTTHLQGQ